MLHDDEELDLKPSSLKTFNKGSVLTHLLKAFQVLNRACDRVTNLWMPPSVLWHCQNDKLPTSYIPVRLDAFCPSAFRQANLKAKIK